MSTSKDMSVRRTPWLIYALGALAELLFGYDVGVIGVALLHIGEEFPLNATTKGFVVSSLLLGAAIGVGVAGRLADRLGRRPVILITGIIFIVGGVLAAFAPTRVVLIVARFIMGLGVGASAVVVSVYLVEVAPTSHRGRVGSLGQLALVIGVLVSYLVGYGLSDSGNWRLMLGLSVVPAAIVVLGLVAMPETPRWLVSVGRDQDALASLLRLGRGPQADEELVELQAAHQRDQHSKRGLTDVLRAMFSAQLRHRTLAAVGLAVLVQFVGTNSILYYAPTMLVHAGFGTSAAVTANLAVGVANVVFTLLGMAMMDKLPRRTLLTIGSIGMTAAMAFLSIHAIVAPEPSAASAYTNLGGMLVFLSSFAFSWGVCVRVIISELFPSSLRGSATGLVLILNWTANFVVGQFFPALVDFSQAFSFGLFALIGLLSIVFIRLVLPETGAGKSLEQAEVDTSEGSAAH